MPIQKGVYACYECKPKPSPTVYPICTIRSTPDKPVHCIVWAKELFKLIFGNKTDSMLYEDASSSESVTEPAVYMSHVMDWEQTANDDSLASFTDRMKDLLIALFHTDITKKIDLAVYKTASKVPEPISEQAIHEAVNTASSMLASQTKASKIAGWDSNVWSLASCIQEIIFAMYEGAKMTSAEHGGSMIGKLSFDKDDELAMRFVCAASNIRSTIFQIATMSYHDTKGIAGNIIPAISTTNAIVAGVQVLEAVKILIDPSNNALKHIYCIRAPIGKKRHYLQPTEADQPSKECFVCRTSQLQLEVDTRNYKFGDFVKKVLKTRLGFMQPCVVLGSSILYEEGIDEDDDEHEFYQSNLMKSLSACPAGGLNHDSIVNISDDSLELHVSNASLNIQLLMLPI
jgi:ubiquitin-like 1-activating enzyme E1 B